MNLFAISQSGAERGLPSLLIGGYAVIAHGHPRNTFDLDLVVPRSAIEGWRSFLLANGYVIHREGQAFVQFNPPDDSTLPLDLMIVGESTFQQFRYASVEAPVSAAGLRMVSLKHSPRPRRES